MSKDAGRALRGLASMASMSKADSHPSLRSRAAKLFKRVPETEDADHRMLGEMMRVIKRQNGLLAEMAARIEALEQAVGAARTVTGKTFNRVKHLEPGVEALLRARFIDPSTLPYPERLFAHRFRLRSQNQEDGITLALLSAAGIVTRRFVELGSGLSGGNSAFLAAELGWTGLMVDGDEVHMQQVARRFPQVTAAAAWITAEGVNELIERHGLGGDVDLLSIDVDGNDYWVWQAVTACNPRVVIVEYNSIWGPTRAVTIPYDPQFDRRKHRFVYYGASLAALARLAAKKGYRLGAASPAGINAFFLRNDLAPEIPEVAPERAYRIQIQYDVFIKDKQVDMYEYVRTQGLPLVEVD